MPRNYCIDYPLGLLINPQTLLYMSYNQRKLFTQKLSASVLHSICAKKKPYATFCVIVFYFVQIHKFVHIFLNSAFAFLAFFMSVMIHCEVILIYFNSI